MRKLKHIEIKPLVEYHTAKKCWSQNLNADSVMLEACSSPQFYTASHSTRFRQKKKRKEKENVSGFPPNLHYCCLFIFLSHQCHSAVAYNQECRIICCFIYRMLTNCFLYLDLDTCKMGSTFFSIWLNIHNDM